jgi:FAD:protein FMN transferase
VHYSDLQRWVVYTSPMQKSVVASHTSRAVWLAVYLALAGGAQGACQQSGRDAAATAQPEAPKSAKPATEPAVTAVPAVTEKPAAAPAPSQPVPEKPAQPEPPRISVQRTREMMGTVIQMTVLDVPEEQAGPVLDAAMAEMQRLENVLSEWRPDSEVSQINKAAGIRAVKVSQETLDNVRVGLEVANWSDGAFDLSWAALRGLYLFQAGNERIPTDQELRERLPLVNYKNIVLDEKAQTVFLRKKGMLLGLGGIAKGYALEKASNMLIDAGFKSFMFFGGGQVVVHGKKGNRAWRVGVQHPRLDDYFGFIEAERGSIATSGDYEHAFIRDGQRWHHIIDLKTGRPVQHTSAVTVVSDSPFYADAIDTALFIMGPKKALEKLPSAPGPKSDALLVDKDMRLHMSPGMKDRLMLRVQLTPDGIIPTPQPQPQTEGLNSRTAR